MKLLLLTTMIILLSSQANAYGTGRNNRADNCRNGAYVARPSGYCQGQYVKLCINQGYSKTWQWICMR